LPFAERAAREVLSLPIGPMLSNHAIGRVVDALRQACAAVAPGEVVAA
jgi:dTDP-4-amino-4,6-dideoxygalactose transaminase